MTCTNCGDGSEVAEYTLAFSRRTADGSGDARADPPERPASSDGGYLRTGPTKEIDLVLCEPCLEAITSEPGVELA